MATQEQNSRYRSCVNGANARIMIERLANPDVFLRAHNYAESVLVLLHDESITDSMRQNQLLAVMKSNRQVRGGSWLAEIEAMALTLLNGRVNIDPDDWIQRSTDEQEEKLLSKNEEGVRAIEVLALKTAHLILAYEMMNIRQITENSENY